jgi:predicted transcriptional regulator
MVRVKRAQGGNAVKKVASFFKAMFNKPVEVEVVSMSDLVEKLKWAEAEVEDTKDALLGLQMRLQNGVVTMEEIIEDAKEIIDHHTAILNKAAQRKSEFQAQVAQVTNAINIIQNIYKD